MQHRCKLPDRRTKLMAIADLNFVIYLFIAYTAATLTAYLQHLRLRSPPIANNRIRFEHTSPSAGTDIQGATMSFSYHDDYKAFVFAQHPTHGLLLLYCTRKKKKPNHFQAPGGHVDEADFDEAKQLEQSKNEAGPVAILVKACKIGAARELFEETGIDSRSSLDRLQPVRLRENSDDKVNCELKKRLFFKLNLVDSDFVTSGIESKVGLGLTQSMNTKPPQLMLKLSHEHQGFIFEPNATKAADMLVEHSGGKVAKALRKAIDNEQIFSLVDESEDGADVQKQDDKEIDDGIDATTEDSKAKNNPMNREVLELPEKKEKGIFGCFNC